MYYEEQDLRMHFFTLDKTCAPPNLARVLTGQGGGGGNGQ
jgi:hypothetical protein